MQLTTQDKGVLLLCARESITALFSGNPAPTIDFKHYPNLGLNYGAFVTLTMDDALRGCIGYITSEDTLFDTVCDAAKLAATEDPRFYPLTDSEVGHMLIEISVLSPLQLLEDYNQIVIGRDGLLLEEPDARGVLLPQVAVENKMGSSEFLSSLCQKAGLPTNAWMKKKLRIFTFSAEVFGEKKHKEQTSERR